MVDIKQNPTVSVIPQDPTKNDDYNLLRLFALYWGIDPDDPANIVNLSVPVYQMFERFIQNARPEALGTNQIRIPFANERKPSFMLAKHLIQSTVDVDSAVITGGAGDRFIMAVRSGTTFTIDIRTSSVEGPDDERILGSFTWTGTAILTGSIVGYELEGIGGVQANDDIIVKAWGSFDTTPTLNESHNIASVVKVGTGVYDITFITPMLTANYTTTLGNQSGIARMDTAGSKATTGFRMFFWTASGSAVDGNGDFIVMGDL